MSRRNYYLATIRLLALMLCIGCKESVSPPNAIGQWSSQNSGVNVALTSVYFINSDIGYSVGDSGTILKTTNGGSTWVTQISGTSQTLQSIRFVDANTGFAVGNWGTILKTTNGGNSWTLQQRDSNWIYRCVYPVSSTICYIAMESHRISRFYGKILKTTDGGNSWVTIYGDTINRGYGFQLGPISMCFTDSLHGYVGTKCWDQGPCLTSILKTTDGGIQWEETSSNTAASLHAASFNSGGTGYLIGLNVMLKTTDAGTTWSLQQLPSGSVMFGSSFPTTSSGWAVGDSGRILHTVNGGSSWTADSSGATSALLGVHFVNSGTGFAVGMNGTILKYSSSP